MAIELSADQKTDAKLFKPEPGHIYSQTELERLEQEAQAKAKSKKSTKE